MLRTHIPSAAKHKKMSKVDTLRHAVEYIQSLNRMLNRNSTADSADSETDEETETEDTHQNSPLHSVSNNANVTINRPDGINASIKLETPISPPPEPTTTVLSHSGTSGTTTIHGFTENYESGYETSSYYSTSNCNSMISPVPSHHQYNNHNLMYSNNSDAAENQHYMEHHQRTFNYHHSNLSIEPNSEEDELLDAIANWQDA